MKNKLIKTSIFTLVIMLFMQISVFANTLELNLTADKTKIKIDEEVKITVSWDQGMQAADFALVYDTDKLEYVECNIADDFINNESGEVKTAWFSMDNVDKTELEYTFKAKKAGKVEISTKVNGGFATGELEIPDEYKDANLTIKVEQPLMVKILMVVGILVIILIIFIVINKKRKRAY